jgi:signal transduction histidine kinase
MLASLTLPVRSRTTSVMEDVHELRASRARILAAADEERRRIERTLHDGVQQHLVALAVNVQLARELADSDPKALKALLDEIGQDVRDALESARGLAHGVYPPLLLDWGVAEALRGAAAERGIALTLEASQERFPPCAEAAIYFCCVEALEQGPVTIRIQPGEDALAFEVELPGEPSERVLTAIGDRLGAAGGRLAVDGTRVLGSVPLAR